MTDYLALMADIHATSKPAVEHARIAAAARAEVDAAEAALNKARRKLAYLESVVAHPASTPRLVGGEGS